MTRSALVAQVRRRLEQSGTVFFTDDDIQDALHDAYMEISDATEWYEVWRTVDLCATRPYYDVRTIFPGLEILTPGAAYHADTNRWLRPSSPADLDGAYARWEQVVGVPDRMLTRGLWWLGYWPITSSESGTVKQYATALPEAMDEDTDEPGFDEVFHTALVDYAVADLFPQIGEVTLALEAWAAYEAGEAALFAQVQGRGAVPQVRGYVQ